MSIYCKNLNQIQARTAHLCLFCQFNNFVFNKFYLTKLFLNFV